MRTRERNCSGCRYWSEMLAMAHGPGVEAMCLGPKSPANGHAGTYTFGNDSCGEWAKNSHGAVDDPPDYGETVRAAYAAEANMTYENGRPKFAPDGTMLNDQGNRSIFDDVDD